MLLVLTLLSTPIAYFAASNESILKGSWLTQFERARAYRSFVEKWSFIASSKLRQSSHLPVSAARVDDRSAEPWLSDRRQRDPE
jgi:hypothetical protein